jgi:hypothetical protein
LSTPRKIPIVPVSPGEYFHSSIEQTLKKLVLQRQYKGNLLSLQISVDGVPISKSSGKQFWPILASVVELNYQVFEIGIYCGNEKPSSSNEYLDQFVTEIVNITTSGVKVQDKILSVIIHSFVCDAPARAFILNIKSHNGYFGCGK